MGGRPNFLLPIPPANPHRSADRVRETQHRMWPLGLPAIPGMEYHAGWRLSKSRDVDYLDYFETDGGNFSLAIGNIAAGEAGAPGAVLLSSLHAMVRSYDPAARLNELVAGIHQLFYELAPEGTYATLFLARYDPIERRLDYCNAGHEAPVVLRKATGRRRALLLESGGPMLGVLRHSHYRQASLRLHPGDLLAAYTPGLTESRSLPGEEWGYHRLLRLLEETDHRRVREVVEQVLDEAARFTSATRAADMTLWLARIDEALSTTVPLEAEDEELEPTALAA